MSELSREETFGRRSEWINPISDTHMLGGLTLRAAADYVRTFAQAFNAEQLPIYGHLVAARAALESCVVSTWLSEPGIEPDERLRRGLSEFLYSASEEGWLELRADAAGQVDEWVADAASLGWSATDRNGKPWSLAKSRGKPYVGGVSRPSIADSVTRLLVRNEKSRLGKLQWSRLSAVTHVTFFGLRWALMVDDGSPSIATGLTTVPVGTDSTAVSVQALCIVRALRVTATARFTLMGWLDEDWNSAARSAEDLERALLQAYQAGQPKNS